MSRIYQSVTSYLPFGRKSQPENEKPEEKVADDDVAKNIENGQHQVTEKQVPEAGDSKEPDTNGTEKTESTGEEQDESTELPSNKKTDEVYDPKAQPGYIRWAAGGLAGAASSTVGYGVGGIKWVASTGYNATSTVVTTTTGVIKKVPQVIKRKDKKE